MNYSFTTMLPSSGFGNITNAPRYPVFFVRLYVALPFLWKISGGQFLVIGGRKA